jgi:hypothetical protein
LLLPDAFTVGTGILPEFQQVARDTASQPPPPGSNNPGNPITSAAIYYQNYDVSAFFFESAVYAGGNNQFFFNSPADVQFRPRRYNHGNFPYPRFQDIPGIPLTDPRIGADLVLPNVLSFDVKILDPIPTTSVDNFQNYANLNSPTGAVTLPAGGLLGQPTSLGPNPPPRLNPNRFVDIGYGRNFWDPTANGGAGAWTAVGPFVGGGNNPTTPFTFDTWSTRNNGAWNYADQTQPNTRIPYSYPFNAIQVKVRLWDRKTNQTRELTIVQEM